MKKFIFKSAYTRRIPDPNFNDDPRMEAHIFLMRCKDVPEEIGYDPNARTPKTNRLIYKDVEKSLLGEDDTQRGTFHLKNKGITIIAQSVEDRRRVGDMDIFTVAMSEGHGIVDGGHTYDIITRNLDAIPDDQYVKVEIRTGVPQEWIPMISGGLNTAVQVQPMSLDNLAGEFEWLKTHLGEEKAKLIAWSENDQDTYLDARDLTALMCMFNVELYPNDGATQPTESYSSKAKTLSHYENKKDTFERMEDIILDILILHDTINFSADDLLKSAGRRPGKMYITNQRKRGEYEFPFIGKSSQRRLEKAALYPILASFRRLVIKDDLDGGKMKWVAGDFQNVLEFWHDHGPEILNTVYTTSVALNYDFTALGKNVNLWQTLHAVVGMKTYEAGMVETQRNRKFLRSIPLGNATRGHGHENL